MWYFEVKFGKNCIIGGHFYSINEMFDWFDTMFKYYITFDKAYEIRIWCDINNK